MSARNWTSLAGVMGLLLLLAPGCAGPGRGAPPAPVAPGSSEALAEARALFSNGAGPDDPELRAALARARALAPDWVAPRRFEDDLELLALRAVPALARHRVALHEPLPETERAALTYLAGRLEQGTGGERFARAAALDPRLAWAHHGLAFEASRDGRPKDAIRHQRRASSLARDPWERAYFAVTLARHLVEQKEAPAAAELLRAELEILALQPSDRTWLALEAAVIELQQPRSEARALGYERALAVLRERDVGSADLARMVGILSLLGIEHDPRGTRLALALAARSGPGRERELGRVILARAESGSPLGLSLALRAREEGPARRAPPRRSGWFAAGRYAEGMEAWLADLPAQVLDAEGRPRDPRLAELVRRAQVLGEARDPSARSAALEAFGEALIDAGWFEEARRVADGLAQHQLEPALDLALRAMAGQELLGALDRLARDPGSRDRLADGWALGAQAPSLPEPQSEEPPREPASDLETLLARMAELVARANRFLGGSEEVRALEQELLASPRLGYGRVAQLVHPGPWFSAEDEDLGRGPEGEPVPGLARLMERLGRFGTFGQILGGGGPDGVVLRRLWVERRAGEHLGVPWSGTIAWCEGTDLSARASRAGANIAGAAVHEGYWVDIGAVRSELARWRALEASFDGDAEDRIARARIERVLAVDGLPLELPLAATEERRARARRTLAPLLDQADRLRLAVLAERAPPGRLAGRMTLEELVESVALHEEGHLVDRALHLPLRRNPLRVARLLLDSGFSVRGVQQLLEYRAQLVALCVAPDPRLALVDMLEIGGEQGASPLEHGRAYRRLLADFVRELDRALSADPERFSHVEPDRTLVHQLHRLDPESLRALALRLAHRQGVGNLGPRWPGPALAWSEPNRAPTSILPHEASIPMKEPSMIETPRVLDSDSQTTAVEGRIRSAVLVSSTTDPR